MVAPIIARVLFKGAKKAAPVVRKKYNTYKKNKIKSTNRKAAALAGGGSAILGGLGALKIKSIMDQDYPKNKKKK